MEGSSWEGSTASRGRASTSARAICTGPAISSTAFQVVSAGCPVARTSGQQWAAVGEQWAGSDEDGFKEGGGLGFSGTGARITCC